MGRTRRIRSKHLSEGAGVWDDDGSSGSGGEDGGGGESKGGGGNTSESAGKGRPATYLAYFAAAHESFRAAEFEALAAGAGAPPGSVVWAPPPPGCAAAPLRRVTLPSRAVAREVAARAVLLRALIEVWAEGPDWPAVRAAYAATPPPARALRRLGAEKTFRVKLDAWGFRLPDMAAKAAVLSELDFVPFQGRVDLSPRADSSFWAILVGDGGGGGSGDGNGGDGNGDDAAAQPSGQQQQHEHEQQQHEQQQHDQQRPWRYVYFGREVALAQSRTLPSVFSLKQRRFLGPTSMDAEMAFVMNNIAGVRRGSVVFDPFCGTGSILLAAARLGAVIIGADIDMRVLRLERRNQKTGAPADVFANFDQYGLPWPAGLLRADASRLPFRRGLIGAVDAIVCDPPYGVRAGARKCHAKEGVTIADRESHFASTAPYGLSECLFDLADLAARVLAPGGRLVLFAPAPAGAFADFARSGGGSGDGGGSGTVRDDLPDHPLLARVAACEQPLSGRYSRVLLAYRRTPAPYDAALAAEWREARRGVVITAERVADLVWEPKGGGSVSGSAGGGSSAASLPKPRRQRDAEIEAGRKGGRVGEEHGGDGGSGTVAAADRELATV